MDQKALSSHMVESSASMSMPSSDSMTSCKKDEESELLQFQPSLMTQIYSNQLYQDLSKRQPVHSNFGVMAQALMSPLPRGDLAFLTMISPMNNGVFPLMSPVANSGFGAMSHHHMFETHKLPIIHPMEMTVSPNNAAPMTPIINYGQLPVVEIPSDWHKKINLEQIPTFSLPPDLSIEKERDGHSKRKRGTKRKVESFDVLSHHQTLRVLSVFLFEANRMSMFVHCSDESGV